MTNTKKVIVVSRSFLIVSGIESLVLEINGMLVDTAYSGAEKKLSARIIEKKPDYVIVDPDSVSEILIPLLRELDEEPELSVIGLLSNDMNDKIKSRFSNRLNRDDNKFQLVEALQKIVGNELSATDNEPLISKREAEILRNLVLGLTNQEVADKLFLSVHTVMTHRKKITKKLGIKTVSGLTVYALMNNIVDIREVERG